MNHRVSTLSCIVLCLALLPACSSFAPPDRIVGIDREALLARMGPPEMERRMETGSRLEFPRGPFGKQTWFVYLDAAGQALRAEQVLTPQNFNAVKPGLAQEAVRQLLGRPGEVQVLGRGRGMVWNYRFENNDCQWFQIELSLEQQVRSAGYGIPPECAGHNERDASPG